jgi:oligo-1,6-glucosidase
MVKRSWRRESIVYQIYPKSFCDSDGDGIGDLRGIIGKLDYLRSLGVDVLWLSPIYPSPGFDNGYDVSDYDGIDPVYGTMEDFDELVEQAHSRGLKIIMDLIVNHTSDLHTWFAEKRDFYIWREGKNGGPPNNWGALFGGSAWTRDEGTGLYYLHLFSPRQPDLNWENPELRSEIYAMMRRWLSRGIDGFRMDVISLISKPREFTDGEVATSGYADRREVSNGPRVHEYLAEMRREALAGFDVMTVGEAAGVTLEEAQRYTNSDGTELDMVFQFEHMDLDGGESFKWNDRKIPLAELKRVMEKWQLGLEASGSNALFWNNHDQPRMVSRLGDEGDLRETSAKMLAACLHMLKGTPFIYQGEELGMTNMPFASLEQLRDLESINAYEEYTRDGRFTKDEMMNFIRLKGRDNARTPMQWNANVGAGFTEGSPWIDINPNHAYINAAEQESRPDSVLNYYRKLCALRKEHDVIIYGTYVPAETGDLPLFAYIRRGKEEEIFVCCNFSNNAAELPLPKGFSYGEMLLCNIPHSEFLSQGRLAPYEAVIISKRGFHL